MRRWNRSSRLRNAMSSTAVRAAVRYLRLAIVEWIETTYHRRSRRRCFGRARDRRYARAGRPDPSAAWQPSPDLAAQESMCFLEVWDRDRKNRCGITDPERRDRALVGCTNVSVKDSTTGREGFDCRKPTLASDPGPWFAQPAYLPVIFRLEKCSYISCEDSKPMRPTPVSAGPRGCFCRVDAAGCPPNGLCGVNGTAIHRRRTGRSR